MILEHLDPEEKATLVTALIEKIEREHECVVRLAEPETEIGKYETQVDLVEDIKRILKVTNSRLVLHVMNEGIFLNGEVEFNEALDISNKLAAKGIVKVPNVVSGSRTYMGFKTADEKYSILIPKPNK